MRGLLETALVTAGSPPDAAMFETEGDDPGIKTFYFSPRAAAFVRPFLVEHSYVVSECDAPSDAILLVGDDRARSLLRSTANKSGK